jgi:hypothetical protein
MWYGASIIAVNKQWLNIYLIFILFNFFKIKNLN